MKLVAQISNGYDGYVGMDGVISVVPSLFAWLHQAIYSTPPPVGGPRWFAGILGLCWCKKRPWSRGTFSSSSTGWENHFGLEMKPLLNSSCNCLV